MALDVILGFSKDAVEGEEFKEALYNRMWGNGVESNIYFRNNISDIISEADRNEDRTAVILRVSALEINSLKTAFNQLLYKNPRVLVISIVEKNLTLDEASDSLEQFTIMAECPDLIDRVTDLLCLEKVREHHVERGMKTQQLDQEMKERQVEQGMSRATDEIVQLLKGHDNVDRASDLVYLTKKLPEEDKGKFLDALETNFDGIIKKIKKGECVHFFQGRGIITVWGNAEFASDLSYMIANKKGKKTLLIDVDRLNPTMDLFFDNTNLNKRVLNHNDGKKIGLELVLDKVEKRTLTGKNLNEFCVKVKGQKNLYLLMGSYELKHFEYFSNESFIKLLAFTREYFDVVILSANTFIYDAYTCIALIKSDINLIPIVPDIGEVRTFGNYVAFLSEKQNLPKEKFKYISFLNDKKVGMEQNIFSDIVDGSVIGAIPYSKTRMHYRNRKTSYFKYMSRKEKRAYLDIIGTLCID